MIDLNKNVLIKIGFANTLEAVVEGEITAVKTIFPSNGPPRIEVSGKAKIITNATPPTSNLHCSAECVGVPELKAQVLVSVAGVGNAYNGNYYVEKVTHKLNQSGYTTKFRRKHPKKECFCNRKSKWLRNRCE